METRKLSRRGRGFLIAGFVMAALAIGWTMYVRYRAELITTDSKKVLEAVATCGRLHLLMTREEVLEIMGPALKEYDVRPSPGAQAYFREMLFKFPNTAQHAPYVDLDPQTSKVTEIFCTDRNHVFLRDPTPAPR